MGSPVTVDPGSIRPHTEDLPTLLVTTALSGRRPAEPYPILWIRLFLRPVLAQVGDGEVASVGGYCLTLCDELHWLNINLELSLLVAVLPSPPS